MGRFKQWRDKRKQRRTERIQTQAMDAMTASPEAMDEARSVFGDQFALLSGGDLLGPDLGGGLGYLSPIGTGLGNLIFRDSEANIDRLLRASAWSWAAITGNAKAISQLIPVVQEKVAGVWQKAPPDHPLWAWLDDPLGTDDVLPFWPYSQLSYVTTLHYYIAGNAWWVPQVVNGDVVAVTPILNPGRVRATEDLVHYAPLSYHLQLGVGGEKVFKPRDIVNIMAPSAGSFWRGSSALRAALTPIDTDCEATNRQNAMMRNYLGFGHHFSTKGPLGPNEIQRAALKAELLADYSEAVNQGKPWITGGDLEAKGNPVTTPELQVFETKAFSRTEILAVIGMPPTVAGILDKAILNNFGVSVTTWWHTHLIPVIEQQLGAINAQLVRPNYGSSTRIGYSVAGTDVGLQLMAAKLDNAVKLQTLGYSTNDISDALRLEMPRRDYLDTPNQAQIIAGRATVDDEATIIAPADEPVDDSEEDTSEPT